MINMFKFLNHGFPYKIKTASFYIFDGVDLFGDSVDNQLFKKTVENICSLFAKKSIPIGGKIKKKDRKKIDDVIRKIYKEFNTYGEGIYSERDCETHIVFLQ